LFQAISLASLNPGSAQNPLKCCVWHAPVFALAVSSGCANNAWFFRNYAAAFCSTRFMLR
jgi:hypothetical protein